MNHTHLALLENQAFALMGRMHVILRRQNGRVTDIEYMRIDPGYCRYLLDMGSGIENEDLRQICEKLREIYFGTEGLFVVAPPKPPLIARIAGAAAVAAAAASPPPVAPSATAAIPTPAPHPEPGPAAHADHGAEVDRTYIGRLR